MRRFLMVLAAMAVGASPVIAAPKTGLQNATQATSTKKIGVQNVGSTRVAATKTGLLKSHTRLMDKRLSKQYQGSSRLLPNTTNLTIRSAIPRYKGAYKGKYKPMAEAAARKHGIPTDLFNRLVQQESAWNPRAKSHAGAIGLAQLMPFTAKKLGVDPWDPKQNLEGGARYLRTQYKRFGSWRLALAAYNAGPGAVTKYDGIPPYKETRNYVKAIMGR